MNILTNILTQDTTSFARIAIEQINPSTIVGFFLSLIPLIAFYRSWWANKRKKLKSDLELLSKFNSEDPSYKTIKDYIDYTVKQTYRLHRQSYEFKVYHKVEFVVGIIALLLTIVLAIVSYNKGSWIWWTLTSLYILNGPIAIISSFRKTSLLYVYDEKEE